MSLKGSLQTVALPEVLRFLSGTGKSGEFYVSGTRGEGRLWFASGRIDGFRVGRSDEICDALFEMLRLGDGEFDFSSDQERPADVAPAEEVDLEASINAALQRLSEWESISAVVPSLEHRLKLRSDSPGEQVVLEASQWSVVVAVSEVRHVGRVLEALGLGEFDGCATLRDLVAAGLVEVSEPSGPAGAAPEEAPSVSEPAVIEPLGLEPVSVEPVTAVPEPMGWSGVGPETSVLGGVFSTDFSGAAAEPAPNGDVAGGFSIEAPFTFEAAGEADAEETSAVADGLDDDAISGQLLRFGYQGDESPADPDDDLAGHREEHEVLSAAEPVLEPVAGPTMDDVHVDHYAALRAAIAEAGEDLSSDAPEPEGSASVYELHTEPELDGRAALQALLSEVAAPERSAEPVDALADRGPWTDHELSAMDRDRDDDNSMSNVVPFASAHAASTEDQPTDEEPTEEEEAGEEETAAEEPINRGLLLKFLSSVRN
ncbi:MAG: DUF4388 domain-containing protein [Acidobacteriota bacterium]|nr:DUF4388 domain-containing protein [Acidobacteriota bacterium]